MNISHENKGTLRKFLIPVLSLVLGFSLGFFFKGTIPGSKSTQFHEIRQGGWNYINPLLECEQSKDSMENNELKPFKFKVESFIKEQEKQNRAVSTVSVYFR